MGADGLVVLIALGILCALALAAAVMSLVSLLFAQNGLREANRRANQLRTELTEGLNALAKEVHDIDRSPPVTVLPGVPRPGLNMTKRSEVLRMHRRGDSAAKIAKILELPIQEVELLLKVHRIVINTY